jgi:hypothetical protein
MGVSASILRSERTVVPLLLALSVASVAIAAMTVWAEEDSGFKTLVAFPGHHWVGKGIVAIGAFLAAFALAMATPRLRSAPADAWRATRIALAVVGLSIAVIWVYYVLHYLGG